MPKKIPKTKKVKDISLEQYQHNKPKRANNPQAGLVSDALDSKPKNKTYQHDPYTDPALSWTGKTENTSFDVDTVSLHIHERIDPKRIIKQVLKKSEQVNTQPSLFEQPTETLSLDREFDFYSHTKNWSNRLIAGDSLLVMNSLLEKENMTGKVQMIYMDPPYGIKYNSNFQPFTNKREVKDKDDNSIPAEPEMIKAYRDTWELGIHSYLTYLRDRLLLAKDLLNETGSIFIQISNENIHHVREILDEIFTKENFISLIIAKKKTSPQEVIGLFEMNDYILWYSKDKKNLKYRQLLVDKKLSDSKFSYVEENGKVRNLKPEDYNNPKLDLSKVFRLHSAVSKRGNLKNVFEVEINGKKLSPPIGYEWATDMVGMQKLISLNRFYGTSPSNMYKIYYTDFEKSLLTNTWQDLLSEQFPIYVVQTTPKILQRCILMSTDPGDLVLDITCGSGTTAFVAEQWGRRWITCDTSRVAIQLAKQRLMTAKFDYYDLAQFEEGVSSGFKYKTVSRINMTGITNDKSVTLETLYDQAFVIKNKVRVTGPFTVEAVPGIRTKPIEGNLPDVSDKTNPSNTVSEKLNDYLDSVRTSGIRSYHNEDIIFNSVEVAEGFKEIHAFGTMDLNGENKKCAIIFGPDYAPMEQTQVERTMDEIRDMFEKPQLVIFCSYAFDPEASKDIDNIKISELQILKAQINTDLLTKDLKKKSNTNRPFWLIGEPDIEVQKNMDGKYQIEVKGFDYYDPSTQELKAGSTDKIAMWMLDIDYDNKSLFPSQIFFPMQDKKKDWTKLAKALNGGIDEELLEQYTGTISIPFEIGSEKTIAVKIIDDRGVEMLIVKKIQ
ncbi:MAG: site-specific DNA-methyltransferase [Candidatus Pacebacteria bacterium]|nr:site-specific DNA-methyltransferase [Candidatus Paceibacterota bacterium]